jgi:hypothetical protein
VYFPKAVVLAVYADYPATQKITLTGSACPMWFTPLGKMSEGRSYDNEVQVMLEFTMFFTFNVTLQMKYYINVKFCYINL